MKIDPVIGDVKRKIQELITAMQRRLNFTDNISCALVDILDTGSANGIITVNHRLGYIPLGYTWNIDRAGIVYDHSRSTWTATQMTLKCSVANAVVKLMVF